MSPKVRNNKLMIGGLILIGTGIVWSMFILTVTDKHYLDPVARAQAGFDIFCSLPMILIGIIVTSLGFSINVEMKIKSINEINPCPECGYSMIWRDIEGVWFCSECKRTYRE